MSKELTERWKNGELTVGLYYVKGATGIVFIDDYIEIWCVDTVERKGFRYEDVIVEVVERVPSHYQFSQMVKKVEELEKEKAELLEKIEELKDESLYWEKSSLGVL